MSDVPKKAKFTKAMCQKHNLPIFLFDGFLGCIDCFRELKGRTKKNLSFAKQLQYLHRKKHLLKKNGLVECPYHPGVIYKAEHYCTQCYSEVKDELL